jgi:hypothetical protein
MVRPIDDRRRLAGFGFLLRGVQLRSICPCRRQGGRKLTTGSTFGICQFALSWLINDGHFGAFDLKGLKVVLAGFYRDDEPGSPWRVALYIEDRATGDQREALENIFLGRLGGTPASNFANEIGSVQAVQSASIDLDHRPGRWFMRASDYVTVKATTAVPAEHGAVSCGIPGHDHPGEEVRADVMRVNDESLQWELHGQCGFATDFDYASG